MKTVSVNTSIISEWCEKARKAENVDIGRPKNWLNDVIISKDKWSYNKRVIIVPQFIVNYPNKIAITF